MSSRDHYPMIEAAEAKLPKDAKLVIYAVTGSRAYGTNKPESDWDYHGVYRASMYDVLTGQRGNSAGALHYPGSKTGADSDFTLFELGHFFKLAAAANPTVLEILWADDRVVNGVLGGDLIENRKLFLSKRIEKTYGGYAKDQLKKAQAGSGGSRGVNQYKRTKFKLHTIRLLQAGIFALKFGELQVKVPDPEGMLHLAETMTIDQLGHYVDNACEIMHIMALNTSLPDEPDRQALNDLLYKLRTA